MTSLPDLLRRLGGQPARLYAVLRGAKAAARAPAAEEPLPAEACRARIEIEGSVPSFSVGAPERVRARVTNASPRPWPGNGRLFVSYHWHRAASGVWAFDGGRAPLSALLMPGEATTVELTVCPPKTPASYTLELDLVEGQDGWFAQRGWPALRHEVRVGAVGPEALDEIDYEQVYAAADLTKDFWSVVGPGSVEEFRQLGRYKLDLLQTLGLTPTSSILDVGCGTGSLAEPALQFLSAAGLFYGTDLSEKAMEYCRQRYRRPNFHFARNGMTTLPIAGLRFDFIVFFSVFTHTYPHETRALLAEAARLLAPTGAIVADVFESDIDGDSLGTRAMIVLGRGRIVDLAGAQGLEAQTIGESRFSESDSHPIDRVLRRFSPARAPARPSGVSGQP